MKIEDVPEGSRNRFLRIQQLRGGTLIQVLEYCISVGWLSAENTELKKNLRQKAKEAPVSSFNLPALKDEVIKVLMSQYDFTIEDAEETVEESLKEENYDNLWHENTDVQDLAKFLASDENV